MPIITAPALVVAPAFEYQPHHPLVGWVNYVTFANLTADSAEALYPVTNLANPNTDQYWLSASLSEQLVTISEIDAGQSDYVAVARHNFGSALIEVAVEAITAEPGADWEEVLPAVQLADDSPAILRFAKGQYIGVRLRLFPTAAAPRCAVLFCGALLAIKPGISPGYVPLTRSLISDRYNGRSESGERLGSIVSGAALRSTMQIRDVEPTYFDAVLKSFIAGANDGDEFFFAWSPEAHRSEVAFAWLEADAMPIFNRTTEYVDVSFDMGGLAL